MKSKERYWGNLHQWSKSVKIENVRREVKTVEYRVPQETILGPLFFNLYLKHLFKVNIEGKMTTLTDDNTSMKQKLILKL